MELPVLWLGDIQQNHSGEPATKHPRLSAYDIVKVGQHSPTSSRKSCDKCRRKSHRGVSVAILHQLNSLHHPPELATVGKNDPHQAVRGQIGCFQHEGNLQC